MTPSEMPTGGTRRSQWLIIAVAAVAAATLGFWVSRNDAPTSSVALVRPDVQPTIDDRSVLFTRRPDFELSDLDGDTRSPDEWLGRPVVLNFWATWCAPCREEMPAFAAFARAYPDVIVVGAAADARDDAQRFVTELGIEYLILAGSNTIDISRRYGNRHGVLPYTAIIDKHGQIAYVHSGVLNAEELANLVEPLRR